MQNDTAVYSHNVDRLQKIVLLLRKAGLTVDIRFPSYIQIGSRLYGAITGAHWAFEDGTEWGDLTVPSSETDLAKIADAIEKNWKAHQLSRIALIRDGVARFPEPDCFEMEIHSSRNRALRMHVRMLTDLWFPNLRAKRGRFSVPLSRRNQVARPDVDLFCPLWQSFYRKEINMAADVPSKARTIAIWALRVVLGLAFLAIGTTKLTGTGHAVEYFAAIGWGQWFHYVTGFLDIAGAALLFVPRWTCYGAIVLTCTAGMATLISLTLLQGNPTWSRWEMVSVPLVLTVLAAELAWLTANS
jgi:putative oxidoreductase